MSDTPRTLTVNLYGGPGTGKSTMMAHVFALLKYQGVNAEMAPEYAKERVWEGSHAVLEDQPYVLGKQLHRLHRLDGKVDVIVTDAPLLFSLVYARDDAELVALALAKHRARNNLDIFLERKKAYNPAGRYQDLAGAQQLDRDIRAMLTEFRIPFLTLPGVEESGPVIRGTVMRELARLKAGLEPNPDLFAGASG